MDSDAIAEIAGSLKGQEIDYGINKQIGGMVLARVEQLFQEIQNQ